MENKGKDKENREGEVGRSETSHSEGENADKKYGPRSASPEIESLNKAINDLIELNNALMKINERQNNHLFIIKLAIVVIIVLLILGGFRFSPYG